MRVQTRQVSCRKDSVPNLSPSPAWVSELSENSSHGKSLPEHELVLTQRTPFFPTICHVFRARLCDKFLFPRSECVSLEHTGGSSAPAQDVGSVEECTWPPEARGPSLLGWVGRTCKTSVPLTQGSVGRHDGDSDRLPGLSCRDSEDETTGDSISHSHVIESQVQQVLAMIYPFLYGSQDSLVVLSLFLEAVETAEEHHQLHVRGTPKHCAIPEAAHLRKTGLCHPKALCHVPSSLGGSSRQYIPLIYSPSTGAR